MRHGNMEDSEVIMQDHSPTGQGGFAVHLTSLKFTVAPGEGISIPVLVYNQGGEEEMLTVSIQGLPSSWVSVPSPLIHLTPGEQREMALAVQPPAIPVGGRTRRMASQEPVLIQFRRCLYG